MDIAATTRFLEKVGCGMYEEKLREQEVVVFVLWPIDCACVGNVGV
jgi:hypothetical protein